MKKLSVVLATRNEEENIGRCLDAVKDIADEIIIFDEFSTDNTREIAKKYGAKVFKEPHHDNFHITKQKAIEKATGEWILQLDADEVVTPALAKEIVEVIALPDAEIKKRKIPELLLRHQKVLEEQGKFTPKEASQSGVVAFFIPRRNMFLGKPLIHAGVYPDPAIRLIKRGKAWLPAKSVHEIMKIEGEIGWLVNDMDHYDSPTLRRYLWRMNRYTDLHAQELADKKIGKDLWQFINYTIIKPKITFLRLFFRHKGIVDGMRGFLWSFFSALHFPLAYYKYLTKDYNS